MLVDVWRFHSIPFLCLGSFDFRRGFLYVLGLGGCGNTGLGKPEGWFRVMDGMWMGWEEKKGSWLVGHSGVACARAFVCLWSGFCLLVSVCLFVAVVVVVAAAVVVVVLSLSNTWGPV